MHPPLTHGFPGLLRKKAVWGDWVVSPVWIVMEPAAVPRELAVSPHGSSLAISVGCVPKRPVWIVTEPTAQKDLNRRVGCVPTRISQTLNGEL